jgi:polyhydroxyalkanoate synthesis repressor PhaR
MTAASPRIIKRYANRKLYDMSDSRYVTLDQISEMIRNGEDVKVIDNSTKDDLTSVTLAQILFEEERKRSFLPLGALRKIIQSGGESLQDFVSQLSESAGRVFRREDGPAESSEATAQDDAEQGRPDSESEQPTEHSRMFREFFEGVQGTIDNWQKTLDANINSAIESVSPLAPLQREVSGLRERIAELEAKLAKLEGTAPPDAK